MLPNNFQRCNWAKICCTNKILSFFKYSNSNGFSIKRSSAQSIKHIPSLATNEGVDYASQAGMPQKAYRSATIPPHTPPRHPRAKRERPKEGKVDTAAASSGQETVSETFPRVFLDRFSLRISNMLLILSENCYLSLFRDGFLITVWSLARCP